MSKEAPKVLPQQVINYGTESKQVAVAGNGLFATQEFRPRSQILFVRRPLILALESSHLDSYCYTCIRSQDAHLSTGDTGSQAVDLKSCTGCRVVRFCNKSCQRNAWKSYHKHECKIFAKLHPRILPSTVRGVMRLLLQRKDRLLPDEEWESLFTMESHGDDLSNAGGERWQDMCLMSKAVQAYSGTSETIETIIKICCVMMVNSFTLTTATYDPIGIALHPLPALINHSCTPNAYIRFDSTSSTSPNPPPTVHHGSISVHALTPILAGAEIRITYVDNTFPTPRRQADLESRFFFTCNCPACSDKGSNARRDESDPAIAKASQLLNSDSSSNFGSTTTKTPPSPSPSHIPALRSALSSLTKISPSLAPHEYPSPQLRHQLILALIADGSFKEALRQNVVLAFKAENVLYKEKWHPSRLVSLWRLWRLVGYCMGDEGMVQGDAGRNLAVFGCKLLNELVTSAFAGAENRAETGAAAMRLAIANVAEDDKDGNRPTGSPPVGQLEVMIYQAWNEFVRGEGREAWREYSEEREYCVAEADRWVEGVVEEVTGAERESGEAVSA